MRIGLLLLLFAACATTANAADSRPQLLVLGTYHMSNPGHDRVNFEADDVTAPERQREVEALVEALAKFRPTRIAVERKTGTQADLDARYAAYRDGKRELAATEDEQIGMRLAKRLGLPRVDAVDYNEMPPVDPDSLDVEAAAARSGQQAITEGVVARTTARVEEGQKRLREGTIADALRYFNAPAQIEGFGREYFNYLGIARGGETPGADWLQYWYGRNLKIVRNLEKLAGPDDRVLVVYGFGHAYYLKQIAQEAGAFDLADTLRYLPAN